MASLNKTVQTKIAIIEPVGGHGGMNYYNFSLSNALFSNGMNATLYTCDETEIPESASFAIKQTFTGIWGSKHKYYRAFRFLMGLLLTLVHAKWNQVKLIHFHFFHYTIIEKLSITLGKFFQFKIVVTVHDVESFAEGHNAKFVKTILQSADKLISHNAFSKQEIIRKIKIDPHKIEIIPHGNYLSMIPFPISQLEARKKLNIPLDNQVVLFFGQIKKVKGLDILLKALSITIKKYPKLKLIVAGKIWKDDFHKYLDIIYKKNLSDSINLYVRYIRDEEVPLFFKAADVIVLPYRKIYQSGVLLMAMSYQVPVIVSNIEGMIEIINDNVNGFVFQTGSYQSLSDVLSKSLEDTDNLKKVAKAGFNTVVEKHDWNSIGEKTAELYKSLLI